METALGIGAAVVLVGGFIVGVMVYGQFLRRQERLQKSAEDQLRWNEDQQARQAELFERQETLCARIERLVEKMESRFPPS